MDLLKLLNENYYMLIPALWVLGYGLKRTPKVPDWSIIWIITIVSLGIASFSFGMTIDAVINGIIAAGISVYGHQLVKQSLPTTPKK